MRASEYSIFTVPRRRSTSACEYGRTTPSKRLGMRASGFFLAATITNLRLLLACCFCGDEELVRGQRQELFELEFQTQRQEQIARALDGGTGELRALIDDGGSHGGLVDGAVVQP